MIKSSAFLCTAFILLLVIACEEESKEETQPYPRWVEDINHNSELDNPDFKTCFPDDQIYQYFNLGNGLEIEGEKLGLVKTFNANYNTNNVQKESGLIRIRFVVNCEGATDRFRLLSSDLNYQDKTFDDNITDQLMSITKSLTGWKQKLNDKGEAIDYYQFLIFRIVDGKILKIFP